MKKLLLIILVVLPGALLAQTPVSIVEYVKFKNDKEAETLYYYKNNWKHLRDLAIEKGYISSYKLVLNKSKDKADFDLILYTEYADSTQFNMAEERFTKLIEEESPDGPKIMNETKPGDFRENLFYIKGEVLFSSEKKKK